MWETPYLEYEDKKIRYTTQFKNKFVRDCKNKTKEEILEEYNINSAIYRNRLKKWDKVKPDIYSREYKITFLKECEELTKEEIKNKYNIKNSTYFYRRHNWSKDVL